MTGLKFLLVGLALALPTLVKADLERVPEAANWYFYVDLDEMRSAGPGRQLYDWLDEEVFDDIEEDSGLDLGRELDRITAFSMADDAGVLMVEGNFSQDTLDKVMAFVATGGDINPLKSSGKTYFRYGGDADNDDDISYDAGNIKFQIDSLKEQSYISTDIKNKIIVTSTEDQMQAFLKSKGKIAGGGRHKGALLILTAEKTLVQAGMRSDAFGGDAFDSNILRNTEEAAFLIAAAADKLALQAKLTTAEPEMAESMASVVRGLIGLATFSDDMDEDLLAVLQGTRVDAKGNSLSLSVAIDPSVAVTTLRD